jgi:hypothetical protein
MMGPGLALEQAPPFSVPLRFFLTAPWFLVAAGLFAAWEPGWSDGPMAAAALALTHLVTLGFLGMVMMGAMTQMLPVVAGAPVPAVRTVAMISHASLALGTSLLSWGLFSGEAWALKAAGLLLGPGMAAFVAVAAISLSRGRSLDTLRAMGVALAALAATLLLGLLLTGWLAGLWLPPDPLEWLTRHALAGLAGWVGILVMGTAWQVVPMLQLTPPYPPRLMRGLLVTASASLAVALLPAPWRMPGEFGLSLSAIVFALATLDLQRRRKRRIADITLSFWRLGLASLILAAGFFPFVEEETPRMMVGLLFLLGFAASVVSGMLYKIVPFLAWFHLQAQKGIMTSGLPSMKDYLPDSLATGQFRLHAMALACLLPAPLFPALAIPGGLLLAASAALLGWNLLRAAKLFLARGGRF